MPSLAALALKDTRVGKSRLEAFSDGVIAIIITIMVLELRGPHGADLRALAPLLPIFLSYVLSFVYVGIYWSNHHHLLHALERGVTGAILWANLHLLFWLSLFPFATGWMGENEFAPVPSAGYGVVLLMAAIAYWLLQRTIIAHDGARGGRRHRLAGEPVARGRGRGGEPRQRADRGARGPRRGRDVDGRGRVRLRALASGYGGRRPRARAPRARDGQRVRAQRA